jgi:hypothetical protein
LWEPLWKHVPPGKHLPSGKHLQPLSSNLPVGSPAKLLLDNVIGPISLFGLQDVPSDRPGYKIRKLKARGIALLVGEDDIERELHPDLIVLLVEDSAKSQL